MSFQRESRIAAQTLTQGPSEFLIAPGADPGVPIGRDVRRDETAISCDRIARSMNSVTPISLTSPARLARAERSRTADAPGTIAVLVTHSDPVVAAGLAALLKRRPGFCVSAWQPEGTPTAGIERADADVVIADYESGLRLMETALDSSQRLLIFTANTGEAGIVRALRRGVRGYLLSGCSLPELLRAIRVVHEGGVAFDPFVARCVAANLKQQALTPREQDTLKQMMDGLSNKRIAINQGVREGTVKTHVKSILAKLGAHTRTQAVMIAQQRGVIEEYDNHASQKDRVTGRQAKAASHREQSRVTRHLLSGATSQGA